MSEVEAKVESESEIADGTIDWAEHYDLQNSMVWQEIQAELDQMTHEALEKEWLQFLYWAGKQKTLEKSIKNIYIH